MVSTCSRCRLTLALVLNLCLVSCLGAAEEDNDLIEIDTRWEHPRYLTWRPGDGQTAVANPPRLSWPYLANVVPGGRRDHPVTTFRLQIADNERFRRPRVDVDTNWNFYNALPSLQPGTWFWRVRAKDEPNWRPTRSFIVARNTPRWDRTNLLEVAKRIGRQRQPRLGPELGGAAHWAAWAEALKADRRTSWTMTRLMRWADAAVEKNWYTNGLPASDARTGNERGRAELLRFESYARECAWLALAWRLTDDDRYRLVLDRLLELAAYPPGGLSSPEGHGSSIKFTTRIALYMALCYDWLYDRLDRRQRRAVIDSIAWRITAPLDNFPVLAQRDGTRMLTMGVAIEAGSHPYQNLMWLLPAALIVAGEHRDIDAALEPMLHYLVGVSGGAGADEAWNEGPHYGLEKGGTMLRAILYAKLLAPQLRIEKNPFLDGYGRWLQHLLPYGTERLAFGDATGGDVQSFAIDVARGLVTNAHLLGLISEDGGWQHLSERGVRFLIDGIQAHRGYTPLIAEPWLIFTSLPMRPAADPSAPWLQDTHAVFPESGWAFARSHPGYAWEERDAAVGVMLQARPRGGYSHSYRSDGTIAWHAFGHTLSAGGGTMLKLNPHSMRSIAHNTVLINGIGQEYTHHDEHAPAWLARIIAARTFANGHHWVADMSPAFPAHAGATRWHRHVVFAHNRHVILIDDLAAAKPARFSWLWHIDQADSWDWQPDRATFTYTRGQVTARVVHMTSPDTISMDDRTGLATFTNPITGDNHFTELSAFLERLRGNPKYDFMGDNLDRAAELGPDHLVWTTNTTPTREWTLVTVLLATNTDALPTITAHPAGLTIQDSGQAFSLSWSPSSAADYVIDLDRYRTAAQSE